ncbi:hypothetical protein SEUBUCD646_0L03450 [Saccharomyces eubayanus]|uniref:Uncharacterized protein n=2 Tax=Saccharomyces TaxID=4930 RepID=A0A6C1EDP4_SACPS|nr:hypothetical protein GRS66_009503 [Saccharomyces pastorianus]CAI1594854.1 hypothetical protein SEUBUCD650_0L03440 [Saccharomyces eubayanus]CAI1620572.1 hypothetical protein SEUBUCD646_0L03450 [Saccharomyces eubayanus]
MVEGDFVNEQTNVVSQSSNFLCAERHGAKASIGDEILKLLLKILNSDETVAQGVHTHVAGSPDLSDFGFENEQLENVLAVLIISFIIVVVGVLLLGLIGMIFISFRSTSSSDKQLQCDDEEKQVLAGNQP